MGGVRSWNTLDERCEFEDYNLVDNHSEVPKVKSVDLIFEDGSLTGVIITQKDGTLLEIGCRQTQDDGCRRVLYATMATTKEKN